MPSEVEHALKIFPEVQTPVKKSLVITSIKASNISFLSGNCPDLIISTDSKLSGKLVYSFSGIRDKGSLSA